MTEESQQRNTSLKDNNNYQTEITYYSQVHGILVDLVECLFDHCQNRLLCTFHVSVLC